MAGHEYKSPVLESLSRERVIEILTGPAKDGDPKIQYMLAKAYELGGQFDVASYWYRQSAESLLRIAV
jgi:hypothetical protein